MWPQGSGQSVWYSASWPVGRIRVGSDDGKNRGLAGNVVKWACAAVLVDTQWLFSPSSLQRPHAPPDSSVGDARPRRPLGPRALCTKHGTSLRPRLSADSGRTVPSCVGTAVLSAVVAGFSLGILKDSEESYVAWNALGLRVEEA